nr:hypothetical protein [Tanacetum cinerariifolium]
MKESYVLFDATNLFVAAVHAAAINCMVGTARYTVQACLYFGLMLLRCHQSFSWRYPWRVTIVTTVVINCMMGTGSARSASSKESVKA